MASPTVTKQVLENGSRNYVAKYSAIWDNTHQDPLSAYLAADPTSTGDMGVAIAGNTLFPGTHLKIVRLSYDISAGIGVQIYWDAGTPVDAWIANGEGSGKQMFRPQGGLFVPQSGGAPVAGATGKLLFNTLGVPVPGQFFTMQMWLRKDITQ